MKPTSKNEPGLNQLEKERDRLFLTYQTVASSLPDQGLNIMNRIRTLDDLIQDKKKKRAKRHNLLDKIIAHHQSGDNEARAVKQFGTPMDIDKSKKPKERKTRMKNNKEESEEELFFSSIIRNSVEKKRLNENKLDAISTQEEPRRSDRLRSKISKVEVVDLSTDCSEQDPSHDFASGNFKSDSSSCSNQSWESLLSTVHAIYPPNGGKGHVQITVADLARLQPDEYLNDICINFYLKHIEEQCPFMERIYIFRSYFYSKLLENPSHNGANCWKWTKEVDIFDYDYIFIPICDCFHWSLAVICFVSLVDTPRFLFQGITETDICTPCILHFDSLEGSVGHSTDTMANVIRLYLEAEWNRKKPKFEAKRFTRKTLPSKRLSAASVQENSADCGLFLLVFLENFCYQPPDQLNFKALKRLNTPDRPFFLTARWLNVKNVSRLRSRMLYLMHKLFLEQIPAGHPATKPLMEEISKYESNSRPKYKTPDVVFKENLESWKKDHRELVIDSD